MAIRFIGAIQRKEEFLEKWQTAAIEGIQQILEQFDNDEKCS
jgi:hypothetical protein